MEIILPASGILSKGETQKFKLMLIQSKLQENVNRIMLSFNLKNYTKTDFKDIVVPDSAIAKRAIEEAREYCNLSCSPFLQDVFLEQWLCLVRKPEGRC
jgi:hypothetical protein